MTAFRKWALRFLAALLTLGVLVAIAFLVVIRTQWARDSMRKLIVEQTERATGGKVQIGKFDFDALRLEFSVRDFVLRGKEPSSDPPLAHVAGIRAGVTVVSFFRRDAYLAVLEVDRPNIRIVTYPDGSTNIPGPKVRTGPTVFERFVSLSARKFFLKDGLFIYDGRRFPLDLRAEKLSVQFSAELDGPRYRGVVSAAPFHFHYRKIGAVQVDAGVRLTMDKAGLVFEEARIRKGTSNIQASGWMKDYRSPKVEVDAIADIAVADFKNLFRLPVAPEGRVAYKGKLTADEHGPELTGVAHGTALAVRQPLWAITGIEVRSTLALTKDLAQFRDIAGEALGGSFQGEASIRNWRTFDITGAIADLALEEMEVLGQTPRPLAWSSTVSGPVSVSGNLSPEGASNLAVSTNLAFQPSEGKTPLAGSLSLQYRQDPPLLSFAPSYLKTPRTRVDFRGEPNQRMSVRVDSADLNDFLPAAALFSENAPAELPIQLDGGAARFEGTILNPLKDPRIEGSVSLSRFVAGKRAFDSASAKVTVDAARLTAQDLKVEQRGAHVEGRLQLALDNWRANEDSAITAHVQVLRARIEDFITASDLPMKVQGVLNGPVELMGTAARPELRSTISLTAVKMGDESFRAVRCVVDVKPGQFVFQSCEADHAAGRIAFHGRYDHPDTQWDNGVLAVEATTKDAVLRSITPLVKDRRTLDGRVDLAASSKLRVEKGRFLIDFLTGGLSFRDVTENKKPIGSFRLTAATRGERVSTELSGDLLGSPIRGKGEWQLSGDADGLGQIELGTLTLAKVNQLLQIAGSSRTLPLEGKFDSEIAVAGSLRKPGTFNARINVTALEFRPLIENGQLAASTQEDLTLRNTGPLVLQADSRGLQILQGNLVGKETNIQLGGHIATSSTHAWNVEIRGSLNLGVFNNAIPGLHSAGVAVVNAGVRGTLEQPVLGGRMEIRGANVSHRDLTNSIDNANGTVLFDRNRALLQSFTAQSGGGELKLSGFIGLGGGEEAITYRINGLMERVRIRYPEGTSNTVDASLSLSGTSDQSLLSGTVTLLRSGFNTRTDIAAALLERSRPVQTPPTSAFLRAMQFDVRLQSGPGLQLETTLTQGIQASVDLRLKGSPAKPVLLGTVTVNQGMLDFLGTKYKIARGAVSFFNIARVEPVVDLDMETTVRAVTVNMSITGPIDKPNITYRSDPPFQTADIIALLAVGRTPVSGSAIAATQTNLAGTGSGFFAGTDTLVGQAVSAGVSSRLQRFFGVSRVKIDPQLVGLDTTPQARLTIEQQISRDITLTYVTNLTGALQQLVRLQWDFRRNWSVTTIRDENGVLGGDLQYRKRFK